MEPEKKGSDERKESMGEADKNCETEMTRRNKRMRVRNISVQYSEKRHHVAKKRCGKIEF